MSLLWPQCPHNNNGSCFSATLAELSHCCNRKIPDIRMFSHICSWQVMNYCLDSGASKQTGWLYGRNSCMSSVTVGVSMLVMNMMQSNNWWSTAIAHMWQIVSCLSYFQRQLPQDSRTSSVASFITLQHVRRVRFTLCKQMEISRLDAFKLIVGWFSVLGSNSVLFQTSLNVNLQKVISYWFLVSITHYHQRIHLDPGWWWPISSSGSQIPRRYISWLLKTPGSDAYYWGIWIGRSGGLGPIKRRNQAVMFPIWVIHVLTIRWYCSRNMAVLITQDLYPHTNTITRDYSILIIADMCFCISSSAWFITIGQHVVPES